MALTKTYAHIELADGSTHSLRCLLVDKRLAQRTATVHKWDTEGAHAIEYGACLAYSAAKRGGLTEATFEDFLENELVDIFVDNDEPTEDDENPI